MRKVSPLPPFLLGLGVFMHEMDNLRQFGLYIAENMQINAFQIKVVLQKIYIITWIREVLMSVCFIFNCYVPP